MINSAFAPQVQLDSFGEDVLNGLTAFPKRLSSKWFYDAKGDELFQGIMAAPEYYLTSRELEIFQNQADRFLAAMEGQAFDLVELGAGDGTKTQYLIEHFLAKGVDFNYLPIDISQNALDGLGENVRNRWPNLPFHPVQGDYFDALDRLPSGTKPRPRLVLFPGANIGNFKPVEAADFLARLRQHLRLGDTVAVGFDLKKDPSRILAAYNDAAGYTSQFNLNLLQRINRELDANFDLSKWQHWPTYDPVTGATRSFLVSKEAQAVFIKGIGKTISFAAWEAIDMEISQKYSLLEIEALARRSGYEPYVHLQDAQGDFVDSIWRIS